MRWALSCPSEHVQQIHFSTACDFFPLFHYWAVLSMILVLPYKKKSFLSCRIKRKCAGKLCPERRLCGHEVSVRGRKKSHFYLLKADEFNLRWQCQNRFQPFTPTSASLIMLPVPTQTFKNQYNLMQLPVASGNGKACQEWEMSLS